MGLATPPIELAIKLADEGVPLRAIARAVDVPSEEVRDCLSQARANGRLLSLPREDWPPGFPRDERALQLSRLVVKDREAMVRAVGRLFDLTATETRVLLALVQSSMVARLRADMNNQAMNVHVHWLRKKLAKHNIGIETVRSYGYQLSPANRQAVTALILARVEGLASL
jgi:hypothetical protein